MSTDSLTILLVEDNPADVAFLKTLLRTSDAKSWQITEVKRLSLALTHLQTASFDAILLDLSLPDSQGLDAITQVQAIAPDLPIVVLTGLQDQTIARQAVAQGAQDYLVKGQVSSELLIKTVTYAIERSQILGRLRESEQCFHGVFAQTFQFMGLLSQTGLVLRMNQVARDLMGRQDEAMDFQFIWEAPCWQLLEPVQSWLKMAVLRAAQGETMRSELQSFTLQGTSRWLDFSIKPLRDEQGDIMFLIAEGRDISQLKQAEAETLKALEKERELNQMKNSFISMVSHEFRNPICSISYGIDFLEDFDPPADQRSQCYERMRKSIDETLQLLDEILLLGRTESGRIEVNYTLIDLKDFCSEIVETFKLTQGQAHQIIFIADDNSIPATLDANLLKHIVDNLLSNAIKYSPQGGVIRLTLTSQENQAKLCIQDQGLGIPEKDQERLFEPFHRAANVHQIQGTGLGLAIVKRCVDLQNGQIHVESQEGIGTTFTVVFPLNPTQPE